MASWRVSPLSSLFKEDETNIMAVSVNLINRKSFLALFELLRGTACLPGFGLPEHLFIGELFSVWLVVLDKATGHGHNLAHGPSVDFPILGSLLP